MDEAGVAERTRRPVLVAAGIYLVMAVVLWWGVWSAHPTSVTTCGCGDSSLITWFFAWPATAIAHGQSPLWSPAMLHPSGVNLLANTSELAFGVVLAPVTWTFGPVATLNVALTLSPALSALALFAVVRRWVTFAPAAFAAGVLYGFGPFVVVSLADAHLMIGMLAVPPLILGVLDELLVRRRRRPATAGAVLGLLVAVQFFIGTEVLVIVCLVGVVGVGAVTVGIALPAGERAARLRHEVVGLATAAAVAGVVLAYPLWFALAGPAHLSGAVWPGMVPAFGGVQPSAFAVPVPPASALAQLMHAVGGYQGAALPGAAYVGLGSVAVVVAGLVLWRRWLRLWFFAGVAVLSALLSVEILGRPWAPWRLFDHLALLQNVIPGRFAAVTVLASASGVALVADRIYGEARRRWARGASDGEARSGWRRWAPAALAAAILLVAVVPPEATLSGNVPLAVVRVAVPRWFATIGRTVPPGQVLLVLPPPFTLQQSAMTWQAIDGMRFAMAGGGGPGGVPARAGAGRSGEEVLASASAGAVPAPGSAAAAVAAVRQALRSWGVTMVVLPVDPGLPVYDRVRAVGLLAALVTAATGVAPSEQAEAWVWSGVGSKQVAPGTAPAEIRRCAAAAGLGAGAAGKAARCMLGSGVAGSPVASAV